MKKLLPLIVHSIFITSCIVDDPIADENISEADDPSNFGFINSYF